MIAKVIIGNSFRAVCFYLRQESKDAEVLAAEGVRTDSAQHMAEDFTFQQQLRPTLGKAVLHIALSLRPEDAEGLSSDEVSRLLEAAGRLYRKELAKEIGPLKTQWTLVQHFDKDHPHAHLVLNRVDDHGKVIPDTFIGEHSRRACQRVEQQLGLATAEEQGREQARREGPTNRQATADTPRKVRIADWQRARHTVADVLKPAATGSGGFGELANKLAPRHIKQVVSEHWHKDGSMRYGVRYEYDGHRFKGGEIGQQFTAPKLLEIFASVQVERQAQLTAAMKKGERVAQQRTAKLTQLPAEVELVPLEISVGLPAKPTVVNPASAPVPPVATPVVPQKTSKGVVVESVQSATPSLPAPPIPAGESTPLVQPPTESQRQMAIFRDAAAGEWDSLDQAKALVRQVLTKALVTTETQGMSILYGIGRQGFKFSPDYTQIEHRESKLIVRLTEVQPGGSQAPSFVEQVVAVAQANQAAERESAQQATMEVIIDFLHAKPFFIGRGEMAGQFAKVGLAASWPGEVAGEGGQLTLTHMALGHSFTHEELPIHGQPLLPQLQALGSANWQNPERRAQIHYRDEAQGANIKEQLQAIGVRLLPAEPASERAFVASYQLDSNYIEQIDSIFNRITASDGARVVESGAVTQQRAAKSLDHYIANQNPDNTQQQER
jgi:hypothetical protein